MSNTPLRTAVLIIEEFRKCDPLMSTVRVAAFLYIAENPHCSVRELCKYLDVNQSSISKVISYLGPEDDTGGLSLINIDRDEEPPYGHRYTLSPKGRKLINSIQSYLN